MADLPDCIWLGDLSTQALSNFISASEQAVLLWPVGSTEPHGPHLPLATDIILSTENAERAADALRERQIPTLVAPPLPYGVTDFAAGFDGAISIPIDTMVDFLSAGVSAYLDQGFTHVCLINHHLEPGQLKMLGLVRKGITENYGPGAISYPEVVSRRWGAKLGDEFRSGACHAGSYEGSLVLAATPELVDMEAAKKLPEVPISLSSAIKDGQETFLEAGAEHAYTGRPGEASAQEGESLYEVLTEMVVTEVMEHLELKS
jgi:creatinine amidohydrolase